VNCIGRRTILAMLLIAVIAIIRTMLDHYPITQSAPRLEPI
jgi:hypothetical protein